MEDKSQLIAAIDVGTTKIVALLGKRNENKKIEIVGFVRSESKGIRRGEVLNPEEAAKVVRDTITDLQKKTGVVFSDVFVGIAGDHIGFLKSRNCINRDSYDDSITAADIDRLIRDANNTAIEDGKEIIRILPQSYIVDNETDISSPIGMLGRRLEANFNIVVASTDSIKRIKKCIHQAGFNICGEVILEPLASADAVLYDEEREAGVALVDIGGGTTDVAVFHNKVLCHSVVIPFGGFVVTKDIKESLGLMEQVAEDVKLQFGMALGEAAEENKTLVIPAKIPGREPKEISIRSLANIIQARMEEIIDAIMFEIENSGYAQRLGYGIVITGGGSMLRHLKELFRYQTGLDVRIGYPGEHLAGDATSINEPSYSTAIGLLMQGFEYMDNNSLEMVDVKFASDFNETKPEPEPAQETKEKPADKTKERKPIFILEKFKDAISRHFDVEEPEGSMR